MYLEKQGAFLHVPHSLIHNPLITFLTDNQFIQVPPNSKCFSVLIHPIQWVFANYLEKGGGSTLKLWYLLHPPSLQRVAFPLNQASSPNAFPSVRGEHLVKDLEQLGIEGLPSFILPCIKMEICLQTRASIRARYQMDYQLGDYE